MINIILVTLGTFILCASAFVCQKLEIKKEFKKFEIFFNLLLYLIVAFIFGYSLFLIKLFTNSDLREVHILTISIIFFAGSIFVLLSIIITDKLLKVIESKSNYLKKINSSLLKNNNELNEMSQKLIISEKKYAEKAKELEEKIEDLYTMKTELRNEKNINN